MAVNHTLCHLLIDLKFEFKNFTSSSNRIEMNNMKKYVFLFEIFHLKLLNVDVDVSAIYFVVYRNDRSSKIYYYRQSHITKD